MTTLKIQNESTVQSIGEKRNRNAKSVFIKEHNRFYNSGRDAAIALQVKPATISAACNKKIKSVKGVHPIFASEIIENFDDITAYNRDYITELELKAKAYDAIMAEKYEREKKQERIDMLVIKKAKVEERRLRREERIKKDAELIMEIEAEIKSLNEDLSA